jgi:thioredoxin-like negative regulator of GroEL
MDLANQTTPTVADFDTVRAAMEAERGRGGAVPAAFRGLAKQDALDKEVEDRRRAVAAEPNSPLARMRLADALRDSGDVTEAVECYR